MAKLLFLISFLFSIIYVIAADPLHVTIPQGDLVGKEITNENGKVYRSYSGIPYAKPPVGNLRFKPPQKPEPWEGTLDATQQGSECLSYHIFREVQIGAEDCLFLNIYVPQTTSDTPLPVMFWIHGGAFSMGSGNTDMYGPDYLMDYDVILVTINYRLGALGFLNLELEDAPGNAGLKDQVAALKWVNENIAAFGGDPNDVTIFGESAGGASVHFLMLSDITKGLFQKAIIQSGTALSTWALQGNHSEVAHDLLEKLGHPPTNPQEDLEFLLQVSAEEFLEYYNTTDLEELIKCSQSFVPSIEKRFPGQEPILTESPWIKIESGNFNKVPLMIGTNDEDGALLFQLSAHEPALLSKYNENLERLIPMDLQHYDEDALKKVASQIKKFYFQDEPISENNLKKLVDYVTDVVFLRDTTEAVKITVKHSTEPVYFYEYSFGEYGLCQALEGKFNMTGAGHCDELGFLFTNEFSKLPKDSPNVVANQKRLLQLWTNFAKTGNPTPETNDLIPVQWEPVTEEKLNYLSIGETLSTGTDPRQERVKFWDKLREE